MESSRLGTTILWLRRDLRLTDNPALIAALSGCERLLPVYIHSPEEEAPWAPGAASRWWLHHALAALDLDIRSRGSRLYLARGPTLPTLQGLIAATGARALYWNRLHEPAIARRDAGIAATLGAAGLHCETHEADLLFPPGTITTGRGEPFRVFTPFWRKVQSRLGEIVPPAQAPERLPPSPAVPGSLPLEALGLTPTIPWDQGLAAAWTPGEAGALVRLRHFSEDALAGYPDGRDIPGREASSRLSPHLHFGEVGPRQVLWALDPAGHGPDRETFLRELAWREFARHLLHHFPDTTERPLDKRFEAFPWREDPEALAAWQAGRTGIPLVDAGMRELWETGWMHNRARMIVASLLTKHLGIHWLEGARWLWDTLVDADLANNTLGWQWTAGCGADAAPFFRIFNPVLQGERFDPRGVYVRRWVPELAPLPDRWIHRPWEAPARVLAEAGPSLGRDYPRPVIDLTEGRTRALNAWAEIKSLPSRPLGSYTATSE